VGAGGVAARHPSFVRGNNLASSVNLRSGLVAEDALRPEEGAAQEPVAIETTVIATGARPGDTGTKRELFTEETQTVLVFEKGAVIRLSAAVADGQLLFLTNKATGKEVVTQVLRKRSFRPTSCYVDLEFTEPCPGFWGIEFPKATKSTGAASPNAPAKKLAADESSGSTAEKKPTVPPSLQEAERLKHEAAELQTQLKSLQKPNETLGSEIAPRSNVKSAAIISAELTRKGEERRLEELFALEAKQEEANFPKRLVAYPKKSGNQTLQKPAVRKSLVAILLIVTVGAGAYRFGALDALTKKPAVTKSAPSHTVIPPVPSVQQPASAPVGSTPAASETARLTPASADAVATNTAVNPESAAIGNKSKVGVLGLPLNAALAGPIKTPAGGAFVVSPQSKRRRVLSAAELNNKPAAVSNKGTTASTTSAPDPAGSVAVAAGGEVYVGPKLVHAVKPVAPSEALKNYVTGTVNVDALVDSTGHIKSVTVLSGPTKLRPHAVEEMKQYVYQPAKRNGIAVSSHVQVSLQYWYEP
jgi:hypothetical protein